jgi:7tm Odorant receptor.
MFLGIKLVTMSAVLHHLYKDWSKLDDPVEDVTILTTDFNTIFGMLYIPIKIKSFQKIMKCVDKHFIIPSKDLDEVYHNIFGKYRNGANFTGNLFISSGVAMELLYYFIPFISEKIHGNRRLPYEAAFPFDITSGVNYWIVYVILTTSIMTKGINGTIICDFIVSLPVQFSSAENSEH